jgi:GDP-4-dehydro-6-deoxy-D-mannose reductase
MPASHTMPERVLITGAAGFSGRHLARRLAGDDTRVFGLGRTRPKTPLAHFAEFHECDLTHRPAVDRTIVELQPNTVYHLAGISGNDAPAERLKAANVDSLRNLIDSLRTYAAGRGQTVRLLVVGSAAELGSVGSAQLPVREGAACEPESEYGRSKLEATRLALAEPAEGPLKIIVARTFNLIGPGLGTGLSLGRFADRIAAVLRGDAQRIECGNLATRRDYLDVRDAVALYVRLLRFGAPGELYNVCRGRSYAVRELLQAMIQRTGRSIDVVENCAPSRVGDLADIYGDMTKTIGCCGPFVATPIERSLADLVDAATMRHDPLRRAA